MPKNTQLYAVWRKQLEQLDSTESAFDQQIEQVEQLVPLIGVFNAVLPALCPELRPALARVKAAAKPVAAVLKKLEQGNAMTSADEAVMSRFVLERRRASHLFETAQREAELVQQEMNGTPSSK